MRYLSTGTKSIESSILAPKPELKPLLTNLKHVFLGEDETYPIVISSKLLEVQEKQLIRVIKNHQSAIGWTVADIKGISHILCTHCIYLEEDSKPSQQPKRRLNAHLKEIIRLKCLNYQMLMLYILYLIVNWLALQK